MLCFHKEPPESILITLNPEGLRLFLLPGCSVGGEAKSRMLTAACKLELSVYPADVTTMTVVSLCCHYCDHRQPKHPSSTSYQSVLLFHYPKLSVTLRVVRPQCIQSCQPTAGRRILGAYHWHAPERFNLWVCGSLNHKILWEVYAMIGTYSL